MLRMTAVGGLTILALAMLSSAPSLSAQAPTTMMQRAPMASASPTAPASLVPVGPRITSVGVQRADVAPGQMATFQGSPARRDFAWMVLGGATVIVGSIVGGDGGTIIMITGGVIGLVGLWRYLQYS